MPNASGELGMQALHGVPPKLPELAAKLGLEVSELMTLQMEIEAGKSRLWSSHKKMVFKLAHQYNRKGGLPVPDLIMVGSLLWAHMCCWPYPAALFYFPGFLNASQVGMHKAARL